MKGWILFFIRVHYRHSPFCQRSHYNQRSQYNRYVCNVLEAAKVIQSPQSYLCFLFLSLWRKSRDLPKRVKKYCQLYYRLYGLETVCLRQVPNVFGPNQGPFITVLLFAFYRGRIMNGKSPIIYGNNGLHLPDFTYVVNNVEANILACIR